MQSLDYIIITVAILLTVAKLFDCHSTWRCLKKQPITDEANIIARFLFKHVGITVTLILIFALAAGIVFYSVSAVLVKDSVDKMVLTAILIMLLTIQVFVVHNNYSGRSNIVVRTLMKLPPYRWFNSEVKNQQQ